MIMDVDILKSCSSSSGAGGSDSSSSSSMDMMAMMMQMEKFPELLLSSSSSDPDPAFYNTTTLTYPSQNNDDQFSLIGTTTLPIFSNIINNPNNNISVAPPPPPPSNFTNNPYQQQSMTPPPQFQLSNEASGMRLRGAHQNNKNYSSMAAMREMIFRVAVMQPIHIDPESIKAPKRRNVKISKDPQSVAARHRRERISERIRILQRLVPGGTKMDTASMLDEAIHYVKFLKKQVQSLEQAGASSSSNSVVGFTGLFSSPSSANNVAVMNNINYPAFLKGGCHQPYHHPLPMLASSASKQQLLS